MAVLDRFALDGGRAGVAILDATSNDVPGSGTGQP